MASIPDGLKQHKDAALVWATVLMIGILEKKYSQDKGKWKLMANKAINMLKGAGIKYDDYMGSANKLI